MKIICYGDSNTYGYDPRSWYGGQYDTPWPKRLFEVTGWEIINSGENGREIPRRKYELAQIWEALSGASADLLIIMLGTNDLLQGASPETAANRMEAFLTQLPVKETQILLIAPPKMQFGEWVSEQLLIDASARLAECYQKLAQRLGVHFADSSKWNISLTFDGVHFTEEGHRFFAAELMKYIKVVDDIKKTLPIHYE